MKKYLWLLPMLLLWFAHPTFACGGFFCQNSPVDQNAERIIFTQNGDGTISAYIQIQYTGSAPDFAWILPLPSAISANDVQVPEDMMAAFNELEAATAPVFIPPPMPDCAQVDMMMVQESAEQVPGGVTVFASGEVGPYGFDVVGSDDPTALLVWLREHAYRVTQEMEPLINVYVQEGFVFLAMRLLPQEEASDVQPVKVTYRSNRPMIPLRLTAVAANPDMRVLVWFYASNQAVPTNYAHVEVADEEIVFFSPFGGNNYRLLMGTRADEYAGKAFITEYANPAAELSVVHPLLQQLAQQYPYLTRLSTVISPEEMTLDPTFDYDPQRADVSNVRDLSQLERVWDCEQEETALEVNFLSPVLGEEAAQEGVKVPALALLLISLIILSVGVFVGLLFARRAKNS